MIEKYKYKMINTTGIPRLFHYMNRKKPVVLTYHGLFEGDVPKTGFLPSTFVHVENFAKQMAFIKKKYKVLTPQDLLDAVDRIKDLPDNAALITFDDGYESFERLAWPVLKSMGLRAIVFIPTRYVEEKKIFWFDSIWYFLKVAPLEDVEFFWGLIGIDGKDQNIKSFSSYEIYKRMKSMSLEQRDKIIENIMPCIMKQKCFDDKILRHFYSMTASGIKALSSQGLAFGGHTHSHTILSSLDYASVKKEIEINKKKIELITAKSCDFFAYPNGGSKDFDSEHKRIIKQAGYKMAFSLTYKRSSIFKDQMDVSRINVNPEDTLDSMDYHNTGIIPIASKIFDHIKLATK